MRFVSAPTEIGSNPELTQRPIRKASARFLFLENMKKY
jgi:hypothetical protein